jgi:NitT/TauT family transport system substrate-binding protein
LYGNAVIVSAKFAAENPQAVRGFLRALNRGIKETIADPTAAVRHLREREGTIDVALEERRLRLRGNVAKMTDAFSLKQAVDSSQLFTDSFLPPQAERKF